ncbi:MAG TPA: flavodoxin [Oscillospiraceae bacterium]|nr:flavodoxin [Oscillospiraceae bacterium]
MKTIVIYYSVTGQTRFVAEKITKMLGCDIFEIQTEEEIKPDLISRYSKGIKSMFSKDETKLKGYKLNLNDYDKIIVGFPNWGSMFPPAVKAFILQSDFSKKDVYLFTTYAARGAVQCLKNAAEFFTESNVSILGKFSFPKSKTKEEISRMLKEALSEFKQ